MTYNIVEVVPGKYALRRRMFFENLFDIGGEYIDLAAVRNFWWRSSSPYFGDCLTDDMEDLVPLLELFRSTTKIKVVM